MAARLAMLPTLAAGAAAVWPLWIRLLTSLSSNNRRVSDDETETTSADYDQSKVPDDVDVASSYGYEVGYPLHELYGQYLDPTLLVRNKRNVPQEVSSFFSWLKNQHSMNEEKKTPPQLQPIGPGSVERVKDHYRSSEEDYNSGFGPVIEKLKEKPAKPKGIVTKEDGTYIQTQLTVIDNAEKKDFYPLNHQNSTSYSSFVKNPAHSRSKPHVTLTKSGSAVATLSPIKSSVSATSSPGNFVTFTFVQDVQDGYKKIVKAAPSYYTAKNGVKPSPNDKAATSAPLTFINGVAVPADKLSDKAYLQEKFGSDILNILELTAGGSTSSTWLADHNQDNRGSQSFQLDSTTPRTAFSTTVPSLNKYERDRLHSASHNPYLMSSHLSSNYGSKYPDNLFLDHPDNSQHLFKHPPTPPYSSRPFDVKDKYYSESLGSSDDGFAPSLPGGNTRPMSSEGSTVRPGGLFGTAGGQTQYLSQKVSLTPSTSALHSHPADESPHSTNPYYHFVTSTSSPVLPHVRHPGSTKHKYHSDFTGYGQEPSSTASPSSGWAVHSTTTPHTHHGHSGPAQGHDHSHHGHGQGHYSHYSNEYAHYPSSTSNPVYSVGGSYDAHYNKPSLDKPVATLITDRAPDSEPKPVVNTTEEYETSVITNAESTGVRVQLRPMGLLSSIAVVLGGLGMGVLLFPALSATSLAAPFLRRREDRDPVLAGPGPSTDYAYDYDDLPARGDQISRADAQSTNFLRNRDFRSDEPSKSPTRKLSRPKASTPKTKTQPRKPNNQRGDDDNDLYDYYYDYYDTSPSEANGANSRRGAAPKSPPKMSNKPQERVSSPHVLKRLVENVKSAMDYLKRKEKTN
jgi:hypothetical protein